MEMVAKVNDLQMVNTKHWEFVINFFDINRQEKDDYTTGSQEKIDIASCRYHKGATV